VKNYFKNAFIVAFFLLVFLGFSANAYWHIAVLADYFSLPCIMAILSAAIFAKGFFVEIKAEKYLATKKMLDSNPSVIRKSAGRWFVAAYALLIVAFLSYAFSR